MSHDFDLEEFKGAWEQSRHLEQERTKHLILFFTILSALAAVIGFLLKDTVSQSVRESVFIAASVIALILQLLTIFIMAAIRRIGMAREQHERAMMQIRRKLESDSVIRHMWESFSSARFRWWSVQGTAEITLHLFAIILATGNTLAIWVFAVKLNWYSALLVLVVPWLIVCFHFSLAWKLEKIKPITPDPG